MALFVTTDDAGLERRAVPLIEFFEMDFLAAFPHLDNHHDRHRYRRAIRLLSQSIGHEATTDDLNRSAVGKFRLDLAAADVSRNARDFLYRCLTRIWRLACGMKIVNSFDPPHDYSARALPVYVFHRPQAAIAPEHRAGNCSSAGQANMHEQFDGPRVDVPLIVLAERYFFTGRKGTRKNYPNQMRRSIRIFASMLDREPTTSDLTAENLSDFHELLELAGIGQKSRSMLYVRLRAIWRFAARLELTALAPPAFYFRPKVSALPPAMPNTLRGFAEFTYIPTRLLGRSLKTIRELRQVMYELHLHYGRDVLLEELNDALAGEHFAWLLNTGITSISINRHRSWIFATWRMAQQRGKVDRLPTIPRLRINHDPPDAWNEAQARRILTATESFRPGFFIAGIAASDYFRALLLVGWWTALRTRTLFSIRMHDIDFETSTLFVPGRSMKNGRGKRFMLGADAIAAIRNILAPQRELLFPCPFHLASMSTMFGQLLADAGVPLPARNLSMFHKWRRTVATQIAIKAGLGAACGLLGHSSEYVTKRYVDESQLPTANVSGYLPMLSGETGQGNRSTEKVDKLKDARSILAAGHCQGAAAMARVVLERLLQHGCKISGGIPDGAGTKQAHNRVLLARGWIDQATSELIREIGKIGNRGAHGKHVAPEQARKLISGVD
jgi:integrase